MPAVGWCAGENADVRVPGGGRGEEVSWHMVLQEDPYFSFLPQGSGLNAL